MRLKDKLALTRRTHTISFFNDGVFLRFYNESAYILTVLLDEPLKLSHRNVIELNNQMIISGGFLKSKLATRFPNAQATAWGYEVKGVFEFAGYSAWWDHLSAQAGGEPLARQRAAKPARAGAPQSCLTQEQIEFINSWEQGRYPHEVEQGFLRSLKRHLTTQC